MAQLKSRFLPGTTSPRSPQLIVEYLTMLAPFEGEKWNNETQEHFYGKMKKNLVSGSSVGKSRNPALSARDKINRAPKLLGLVSLTPVVSLTEAGKVYLNSPELRQEVMIRQMMKVQFPSPIHKETAVSNGYFNIHPYLELLRLIHVSGGVFSRELKLFGVTLTDYRNFEKKISELEEYRKLLSESNVPLRKFHNDYFEKYVTDIYQDQIDEGKIETRQSRTSTAKEFVKKKIRNINDYGDAFIRYLVGSGLVVLTKNRKLQISSGQLEEVKNLLETMPRKAEELTLEQWEVEMYNVNTPELLSDNEQILLSKIENVSDKLGHKHYDLNKLSLIELKRKLFELNTDLLRRDLISYSDQLKLAMEDDVDDILETFDSIRSKAFFDNPLYFEWNVWRALTMIIDESSGIVIGNFQKNSEGYPIATASGNKPDIFLEMEDTNLVAEVTLSGGKTQYSMEGAAIVRHAGELQKNSCKDTLGIFVAPTIDSTILAELYSRYKINLATHNGNIRYIPLDLRDFIEFFVRLADGKIKINERGVRKILNKASEIANFTKDEFEWKNKITSYMLSL